MVVVLSITFYELIKEIWMRASVWVAAR